MSTVTDAEGWVVETTGTMPPQESSHDTAGVESAPGPSADTAADVPEGRTDGRGSDIDGENAGRVRDDKGRFSARPGDDAPAPDSAVTPPVDEPKPPSKRSPEGRKLTLQQEIDWGIKQREQIRREIEAEQAKLASIRQPSAPTSHQTATTGDFPSYADWIAANPDHPDEFDGYYTAKAKYIAAEQFQTYVRSMQEQQSITDLRNKGQQAYSDWDDTFNGIGLNVPPPLWNVILTDPDGHRLAYEIAKHPDQHHDVLYAKDGFELGVALGTLKARLGSASLAPPQPQSNSAPPPISPVGSSHASLKTVSLDEKPFSQWTKADVEAERLAERKKGLR